MNVLEERLKFLMAQAKRGTPQRQAVLWRCHYVPRDRVFVIDMRAFHATDGGTLDLPAAMALTDLDDAPRDAVLAVVHPTMHYELRRDFLQQFPCTLAEADRLMAEALIELALQDDPDLRRAMGW